MQNNAAPLDGVIEPIADIQSNILTGIVSPLLSVITAFAFAYFIYGLVRFLILKDRDPAEMEKGKKHMLLGGLGLFIILSLWGIMKFIADATDSNIWFR